MQLACWIGAIVCGLVGAAQGLKYTQTPNKTHLFLGFVFLVGCGILVYLAMTTKT